MAARNQQQGRTEMRLSTVCLTAVVAMATAGIAHANLIQNGDFSATTGDPSISHELGWNGFSVDHWTKITNPKGGSGYAIWYPDADGAVNSCNTTHYGCNKLWAADPAPNGSAFIG